MDGFIYNTCLLALERMIYHKVMLARSIQLQLINVTTNQCALIDSMITCHIEVLLHQPAGLNVETETEEIVSMIIM